MNREQKAAQIDNLHTRFAHTPLVVLTDFKGSKVTEMDAIRRGCERGGVFFQVVKNTLAVRALEGTGKEALADHFRGNIGVMIATEDPIAAAKLLRDQAKANANLVVRAGFFEGDLLDGKGVAAIAELPSKEELQATLLATLQQAPRQVLGVLQAPGRDLLFLLQNYASKLESGSEPG
jgi:large subunit ribosomal protein L10